MLISRPIYRDMGSLARVPKTAGTPSRRPAARLRAGIGVDLRLSIHQAVGTALGAAGIAPPVADGLDLVAQRRRLPSTIGAPIMVPATPFTEAIEPQVEAAGAAGSITDPFKPEQLPPVV